MGGEVSKANSKGMGAPTRIPPNFLQRLDDIRKRRRLSRATKQSTPSKRELLSHAIEDEEKEESIKIMKNAKADEDRVAKIIEAIVHEEEEGGHGDVEDHEGKNDTERMIKRHVQEDDGDAFPGSPSFRVYFKDNNVEDKKINEVIGKTDVFKDTTTVAATKPTIPIAATVPSTKEPVEKKERKRKSFRGALPKNLLNVRACCSAAQYPSPDRTHLNREKHQLNTSPTTFSTF